ncbi:MAG TPA: hypothetical protein VFM10_06475, partial [Terriglobales bacterium]|nr:hypothetical protein [Terriglobales bacterium]
NGSSGMTELSAITSAVKERIYERAKSPLISTFIIAWIAINFRAIYAFLTSKGYSEAYRIIDLKVWHGPLETIGMVFAFPMASAFLYLAVVPKLEEVAVRLWANGKLKVRSARALVEDGASLDGDSIRQFSDHIGSLEKDFLARIEAARSEHSAEMSRLNEKIRRLREMNCEAVFPEDRAKSTLHNMSEMHRDVLWVLNEVHRAQGNILSARKVFDAFQAIHSEAKFREFNQILSYFSSECLIGQEIGDIVKDANISLSVRGKGLADALRSEGLTPKAVIRRQFEDLMEEVNRGQ